MADTIELMKQRVLHLAMRGKLVKHSLSDNKILERRPSESIEDMPYEIPETWNWLELRDIVDNYDRQRKPISAKKRATMTGSYPYYGASGIIDSIDGWTHEGRFILIGEDGANLITRSTPLAFIVEGKIWVNNHAHVLKSKEDISDEFLVHYISSISVAPYVTGTAQPKLNQRNLNRIKVPIPPFKEQQLIVEKIEEIFSIIDKIAERKEDALQTIQLIRQTTLQQAIQGKLVEQNEEDETVSELIIRIKEERKKLLKEKIISKGRPILPITDEDIPFKLPDNWSWIRLGEVVSFKIGKTPRRAQANYWGEGIPWISISDMNSGRISITNEEVTDKAIEEVFKNEIFKKGTLIMSFKLTIGKTAIMDIDAVHNEAIISIFPFVDHDKCFRDYLLHVLPLVSNKGDFKSAIKGNTLNSTSITNLMIPLPPLSEQKRIVEKIEQIMDICDQMEELFK